MDYEVASMLHQSMVLYKSADYMSCHV